MSRDSRIKHLDKVQVIMQQRLNGELFTIYGTYEEPLFLVSEIKDKIGKEIDHHLSNVYVDEVVTTTFGNDEEVFLVTEIGMYQLITCAMRSGRTRPYKRAIKHMLKEMRKNNFYFKDELLNNTELLLEVVTTLNYERKARFDLEEEVETFRTPSTKSNTTYLTVADFNEVYKMNWDIITSDLIEKSLISYCKHNDVDMIRVTEVAKSYSLQLWEEFWGMSLEKLSNLQQTK